MGRRKTTRTNAGAGAKGKAMEKRRNLSSSDRNRASPAPIIRLYNGLTQGQRDAIVAMGHGSFLDIKCKELHNPIVYWFAQCYQPGRRAFVVPGRGVIPLTEESVKVTLGLPRGQLEVKYYVDYVLEAEISVRLFPGGSSRPKVSDIAKMIENYKDDDVTFKELWMLLIISTVVAPTTDTRISNKCYPMMVDIAQAKEMNLCKFIVDQLHHHLSNGMYTKGCLLYCMLRYFSALDTDHMDLLLGNADFAINAWSKHAIDVIADMDMQEYDSTTFGSMQLKDEFKEDLAQEMRLFGGVEGFNSWMNLNIHRTCSEKQRIKAFSLMQTFASSLDGILSNLVQGLTECSDTGTDNETTDDGGEGRNVDYQAGASGSESDEDEERRLEPAAKRIDQPSHQPRKEAGNVIVVETPTKLQKEASTSASPPAMHSQIMVPSSSDAGSSYGSDGFSGYARDSPTECTQQADEFIRGSAAGLIARLSNLRDSRARPATDVLHAQNELIVANELRIPVRTSIEEREATEMIKSGTDKEQHVSVSDVVSESIHHDCIANAPVPKKPVCIEQVRVQSEEGNSPTSEKMKQAANSPAASDNLSLKKRKRRSLISKTPSRRSPRFAHIGGGSLSTPPEDGKSSSTAFVVLPVVTKTPSENNSQSIASPSKIPESGDGKTRNSAITISPIATKSTPSSTAASLSGRRRGISAVDGKSKKSAIVISPTITEAQPTIPTAAVNTCRTMVVSPAAHVQFPGARPSSTRLSLPSVSAAILGIGKGSPVMVSPEVQELVRKLTESINKKGELQGLPGQQATTAGRSSGKRKHSNGEASSSTKKRDTRMGMFTPPPFDLGLSSQEPSGSYSELDGVTSDEDARPNFTLNAAPIAWAHPQDVDDGNTNSEDDLQVFKLSEEVENFIVGKSETLTAAGIAELNKYEEYSKAFIARDRALKAAAAPATNEGGTAVQSITPKAHPHKVRVKKASFWSQSPFGSSINVTADQQVVYEKIMISSRHQRPVKSNIRKYQIIKYKDSWVYTGDLADSIHGRGELSNHCIEVGIEYLRRTNIVDGKIIFPYQVSTFLMNGEFNKKTVVSFFKRIEHYSLSIMKQLMFPVMQEVARGQTEGNHWYCLSLNIQAQRFEALDSMRGEGNEGLQNHANALVSRIKAIWAIHYATSKVQIQDYELKIINVPQQINLYDCGFHTLHNIEKWDGQNIPLLAKDDMPKLRRVMPYRWITAVFNEEKDYWRWCLDNNALRRK